MSVINVSKESVAKTIIKNLDSMGIKKNEKLEIINTGDELIIKKNKKRDITEIKGLGKHLWRNLKIEEYINKERNSWE